MNEFLSQKIKRIYFLLMIMVVFLHSYNIDIKQGGKVLYFNKGFNWFLQDFISNGFTRIAVPLFFVISGYLFVLDQKYELNNFFLKMKKRVRTLVLPYLIWTLFGFLFYFILQSIPQSQSFFTKKLIKDYSFLEWINAIINEPIPYQLWFLKDLIVMVLLSPIIFFLIKQAKAFFLIIIFCFWIFNQDTIFLTSEALLFFSFGIYIRIFKTKTIEITDKNAIIIGLFWIGLLLAKTFIGFYGYSKGVETAFLKASIIVGLLAFWKLYDVFTNSKIKVLSFDKWIEFSFFLYVFHEPFLTILKKGIFSRLDKTPSTYLLVYFVAPLLAIFCSIIIGKFLKAKSPPFYKIITGNR